MSNAVAKDTGQDKHHPQPPVWNIVTRGQKGKDVEIVGQGVVIT